TALAARRNSARLSTSTRERARSDSLDSSMKIPTPGSCFRPTGATPTWRPVISPRCASCRPSGRSRDPVRSRGDRRPTRPASSPGTGGGAVRPTIRQPGSPLYRPADLSGRPVAMALDQPLLVVPLLELPEGVDQRRDGGEVSDPKHILLQGSEYPFTS